MNPHDINGGFRVEVPQVPMYYETQSAPVSLLPVSRFINQEVCVHLRESLQTPPIVLLCRQEARLRHTESGPHLNVLTLAPALIRVIDKWTLKIPFMAVVAQTHRTYSKYSSAVEKLDSPALQTYYEKRLLKVRLNSFSGIRIRHCFKEPVRSISLVRKGLRDCIGSLSGRRSQGTSAPSL